MISIILVSHCKQITDGLKKMINEMAANQKNVMVFSVGGTSDEEQGTNSIAIFDTIKQRALYDNAILIFIDLGSAILSTESAIDMLDETLKSKVRIIDVPLVEGAFIAAVQSDGSSNIANILTELQNL